jgi:hypothetical protein
LEGSLRNAGHTPEEINVVLVTHLHSDHVGGLTTQDGERVFPNADVYVAKADSDFWLSPEIAAKAPKDAQPFFQSVQAIAAPYITAGKWHTFSGTETIVDGMQLVPLPRHTPGHTGYEFSSKDKKSCFGATSSMRCAFNCSITRSPRFSTSTRLRLRPHEINCCLSSSARMFDRGAAYEFSSTGSLAPGRERV